MRVNRIFDPENVVFRNLGRLVDLVGLSLLWLVFCLPVVTVGPASAALYQAVQRGVVQRDGSTYLCFFRSFRENCRVGIGASVAALLLAVPLYMGSQIMAAAAQVVGGSAVVCYYAYQVLLLLPAGILCWMFPLLSRYRLKLGQLVVQSGWLALRHLPSTVVLALLLTESIRFCIGCFPLVVIVPAGEVLLASLFIERAFRRLEETDCLEEGSCS